jgi:NADPH:quinone reductase-like Zn-dependent oxidoreductase
MLPDRMKPSLPAFHLMPKPRGALHNLAPEPVALAEAAPGEVVMAVRAVGINFRDVLNVLGMYPGDPGPPGGDCAGVVLSVGAGVAGLRPGRLQVALFRPSPLCTLN